MRLATDLQNKRKPGLSVRIRKSVPAPIHHAHDEHRNGHGLNGASQGPDCLTLAGRATNDAVRDWNIQNGGLLWPQGLESLLDHKSAPITRTIGFWQQNLHPEDRAQTAASIRDALAGNSNHWSGEYRFRRGDGNYAHLLERAVIVRDSAGKAVRLVGSLMDITTRKQLQDQLTRSQRMEAFCRLAGGMAHDFNNFLTTILGYSDFALSELAPETAIAKHILEIQQAAARASALTGHLLAFSRKNPLEPRVIEVNSLVTNFQHSLLRLLGDNISVICRLHRSPSGIHIKADPSQLTDVLLNLAVNARDAMPDGGRLTLKTSLVTIKDGDNDVALEKLKPGNYAMITVADTGFGMNEEVRAHLFEPFFTTKEDGQTSGLGLATSYGIVSQSGGRIEIQSKEKAGTVVKIYLPTIKASPVARKTRTTLPTGTETILVLEDDISVRHISVQVLRRLGYDVLEAAHADDAKRLVARHRNKKIHLLLTDIMLPEMSGRQFAEWLRETSPSTRVILISGYLQESLRPGERPAPGMSFLPKPFDSEQLARKVRAVLDRKPVR